MTRTRKALILLLLGAAVVLVWTHRGPRTAPASSAPASAAANLTAPATAEPTSLAPTTPDGSGAPATSTPHTAAPSASTPAATETPVEVTSSPGITSRPTAHAAPQGSDLARDWLTAYLTRPHGPNDTSWVKAITPYSDPALVQTLRNNPTPVGISWSPWTVAAIKATTLPSQPVTTPTRQVSSWLVTITGPGASKALRLYTLTAYQGDNGSWQVSQADQGYYSHG